MLLARYPDKAAHDAERATAIAHVDEVTATGQEAHCRAAGAAQEDRRGDGVLPQGPATRPHALQRQLLENTEEMAEQQRFIAGQDQEKRRVHQRFDAELVQLWELWAARAPRAGRHRHGACVASR